MKARTHVIYILSMPTALINTGTTQSIRGLLDKYPWNVSLHLNPEVRWLNRQSVLTLGDQILRSTQTQLFGRSGTGHYGVFLLVPEICSKNLWHYHGFAWIQSQRRTTKLLRGGARWFTRSVHGFVRNGGCPVPACFGGSEGVDLDRINPSAQIDLLSKPDAALHYAEKYWIRDGKEELVCVDGRVTR